MAEIIELPSVLARDGKTRLTLADYLRTVASEIEQNVLDFRPSAIGLVLTDSDGNHEILHVGYRDTRKIAAAGIAMQSHAIQLQQHKK